MHPPKGVMGLEASGEARADRRRALNSGCVCHPAHRWHGSAANAVRATTACRAVSEFSLCIKWMSWFTTESESMVHRAAMEDAATLERIQAPKNDSCGRQKNRVVREGGHSATQGVTVVGGIEKKASPKDKWRTSFTFRFSKGMSAVMPLRSANLSAYAGTSEM